MTANDRNILLSAMNLKSSEHFKIDRMIELADAEDTKKILRSIERNLYLREEWVAGTL